MSDNLKDDLLDIMGVGESTAESILEVLDGQDTDGHSGPYLEKAIDAAQAQSDAEAAMFLRRYARDE